MYVFVRINVRFIMSSDSFWGRNNVAFTVPYFCLLMVLRPFLHQLIPFGRKTRCNQDVNDDDSADWEEVLHVTGSRKGKSESVFVF